MVAGIDGGSLHTVNYPGHFRHRRSGFKSCEGTMIGVADVNILCVVTHTTVHVMCWGHDFGSQRQVIVVLTAP